MERVPSADNDVQRVVDEVLRSRPNLTREQIERMIDEKVKEFGGIIRRDAAALIVAKELGVVLSRESTPSSLTVLKIRDLASGFRGVDVEGLVVFNSGLKLSPTGKKYLRFAIADETGIIWGVLWDEQAESIGKALRVGTKVRLIKVSIRRYRERNEIYFEKSSSVKALAQSGLTELLQYIERHKPGTRVIRVVRGIARAGRCCIYGVSLDGCEPAVVILPATTAPESDFVATSGCSEFSKKSLLTIRCDAPSQVSDVPSGEGEVSPCMHAQSNEVFGFKAEVLGYLLFRREGGRVYLATENNKDGIAVQHLVIFRDTSLATLAGTVGKVCEIVGAYSVDGTFRESECLNAVVVESKHPSRYVFSKFTGQTGHILNRAAVVSLNSRLRCLNGNPLFHLSMVLDDGVATLRGISNSARVFEKIYSMNVKEACEHTPSALEKILSYVNQELLGTDVLLRARMIPGDQYSLFVDDVALV